MSGYRTILACLSDMEDATATMDLAFEVAHTFIAHVDVLHVRADPTSAVPLVGEGMPGAMVEQMVAAAEHQGMDRSAKLKDQFDMACLTHGVTKSEKPDPERATATWREEIGREEEAMANAGRLCDLIVMARPSPDRDLPSVMTVNAGLMESGRPVLLAPPGIKTRPFGRNIVVFWNGSAEAARAVYLALPVLESAEQVTVFSAREEKATAPGELASYLAFHGITAKVQTFPATPQPGVALLAEAARLDADLIVMGAYTHSRLRQLILGGVTRHMLTNATVPLLMAH